MDDDPLSTVRVRAKLRIGGPSSDASSQATRSLALRGARPAPARDVPDYRYDPGQQIATDPEGRPLVPSLKKEWTTTEGTHTDGDGGDNETWGWEEV
ncbi:MAG: putative ATP-grasp-modified RiPP [Pseudonocardiaceae bacterium]